MQKQIIIIMITTNLNSYLNILLATESAFALQIRNAHWNLISFHFKPMHEWLGELYNESNSRIDEIAERNKMIGGIAHASFSEYQKSSLIHLPEEALMNEDLIITTLMQSTENLIGLIKKGIELAEELKDPGTEDFLTRILQEHEKLNWFLKSHFAKSNQ